jgi:hypothetical protein
LPFYSLWNLETDYLEELGADERMIFKYILKQWDGRAWSGFIWLRKGEE